jgi:hypothetical protein
MRFDVLSAFRKSVDRIEVSLKSDKNNGTLHKDQHKFFVIPRSVLRRMRNVSDVCTESKHISFLVTLFSEIYGILWKNGRDVLAADYNIIRRMRFARRITMQRHLQLSYCNSGYANASLRASPVLS